MRYEVVARKGLLLRESASTTSAKVCEVRKGAFVCDFGEERFVDGVERLEVVTAEGVRGWCSNKSQLLAPRDDTEQPAPEETGSQLVRHARRAARGSDPRRRAGPSSRSEAPARSSGGGCDLAVLSSPLPASEAAARRR